MTRQAQLLNDTFAFILLLHPIQRCTTCDRGLTSTRAQEDLEVYTERNIHTQTQQRIRDDYTAPQPRHATPLNMFMYTMTPVPHYTVASPENCSASLRRRNDGLRVFRGVVLPDSDAGES